MTILINSKLEMKDITTILKSFQEPGLLTEGVSEAIENESERTETWID